MIEPVKPILLTRDAVTAAALDPRCNVVVEACAGSGKTWLLVSRMLRLLLDGAEPSSILAITFTRKGAEEMNTRLMSLLEDLARLPEPEVRTMLRDRKLSDSEIDIALPKARSLFMEVAFASPGITISTFHGWFQQLLAAAPLGFGIADSSIADSESRLLDEAWLSFAEALNRTPQAPAAVSLARLFAERGLSNTKRLLFDFLARRVEWNVYARETLAIPPEAEAADVVAAATLHWQQEWGVELEDDGAMPPDPALAWADSKVVAADIEALVTKLSALDKLPATARSRIDDLAAARAIAEAAGRFAAVRRALMIEAGTPAKIIETWAGKAGLAETHGRLCETIAAVDAIRRDLANLAMNIDVLTAGLVLLATYEKLKRDQRSLDYADLEWRAFDLLIDSVHAETLQYRLDCRYRHILLDEFQDTSPIQWRCVTAWLDASAAADNRPSVFLVGDPKQAIYRFRRTDARLFAIARDYFLTHYAAIDCRLDSTRRNAPAIVDFVNQLFADRADFTDFRPHRADRENASGEAILLPPFARPQKSSAADAVEWRNPLAEALHDDAGPRYEAEAEALADAIRRAVGTLPVESRTARYGDFLILFRRRAPLAIFEQALRRAGVPYLSARSGGLVETLEVRDLVALLTFLTTPGDDLALAQVLRSPLFSASDDDLLALRFNETIAEKTAWWMRLQAMHFAQDEQAPLARARRDLLLWQEWLDTLPVHDLLDRIFHHGNVLERYRDAVPEGMRNGVIANLNAFMALALELDGGRYPSLSRFLDELRRYRVLPDEDAPDLGEVTDHAADLDRPDAVRMMTIHMAKGLEAPIVWLIDAADATSRAEHHHAVIDWRPQDSAPRHFSFIADSSSRDTLREPVFAEEARYIARERMNLLYVAVTRARQYFVMSGTEASRATGEPWLELAAARAATTDAAWSALNAPPSSAQSAGATPVPVENAATVPIGTRRKTETTSDAQVQGIDLHAALERLAPTGRGGRFRTIGIADSPVAKDAQRIMSKPALRRFFAPEHFVAATNEVEIAGPQGVIRIDRLVEFGDEVWVLDYKTGEADNLENRAQVNDYCRLVANLYPRYKVRGALIDVDGILIEVD
ncbi:MAG: UvrD-helicase domain-containing protein [Betaproteobacteria bacterium]|nr:UvrD-helicase domain-containing protein [Betaproteobacteria bacterium]